MKRCKNALKDTRTIFVLTPCAIQKKPKIDKNKNHKWWNTAFKFYESAKDGEKQIDKWCFILEDGAQRT